MMVSVERFKGLVFKFSGDGSRQATRNDGFIADSKGKHFNTINNSSRIQQNGNTNVFSTGSN